jgi:hypothetical protein
MNTNSKHSKKMFEEIIFLRFGTPRMVISDGGTHFIDKKFHQYLQAHGILRQVARQKHQTNKSRIFYRK